MREGCGRLSTVRVQCAPPTALRAAHQVYVKPRQGNGLRVVKHGVGKGKVVDDRQRVGKEGSYGINSRQVEKRLDGR